MVDVIHNRFFTLLRYGLWPEFPCTEEFSKLTDYQWNLIYELAVSQTVEALLYDGMLRLAVELQPSEDILLRWTVRVDGLERRNIKMTRAIAETSRLFAVKSLDVTLLKGHTLARCYAEPLHRNSGDIDYHFKDHDAFKAVNRLLSERKIRIKKGALFSAYYRWRGCDMEHHTRLMDLLNPMCQKYLSSLVDKESNNRQTFYFNGVAVTALSPILMHLHTNAHILKHFIGYGIGLRQFCDMARLCYTYHHSVNGEELKLIYNKLMISKWADLSYAFLVAHLGLPESYLPFPLDKKRDTNWLALDVLRSGNFGFFGNEITGETWKIEKSTARSSNTRRLMKHLFQGFKYAPVETLFFSLSKLLSAISIKKIK